MLVHHVRHFLDFFGQQKNACDTAVNTYCWMDGSTSKVIAGKGTVYGTIKEIARWEKELATSGVNLPTLHITLNETDLHGRRRTNIQAYRVLCCDLDRKISEEELLRIYKKYQVQMVVQSSPQKYHLYWQLERGADLDLWTKLQLGIASKLNGDLQLTLPTSMIRVPGFTRITKDGAKQLCSVMAFKDEHSAHALSVKEIVRMWPWIWEEGEKGASTLKAQRTQAAKIARDLMKARGTSYDSSKFARLTPEAGRNNTLYLTVSNVVASHEEELTYEEALSFGEEVNGAFERPLGVQEVQKTVLSAWQHGAAIKHKNVREKQRLVEILEKSTIKQEKSEKREIVKEKREAKERVSSIIVNTVLGGALGSMQKVPESYLDISDVLVDRLWEADSIVDAEQAATHNVLVSAHKTKYYKKLTDYLIKSMKITGAFKVSGYSVYLKGTNEAGKTVRYRKNLDQESLSALIQDILSRLYLYVVKVSLNGKGTKSSDSLIGYLDKGAGNGRAKAARAKAAKHKRDKHKHKEQHKERLKGRIREAGQAQGNKDRTKARTKVKEKAQ